LLIKKRIERTETLTVCVKRAAIICFYFVFFFSSRRRHTRSDRDWSSDVCSSDLAAGRESVRTAIADAEWKMLDYLGYRTSPEYVTDAVVDWPHYYEASLIRGYDYDATYRRIAVTAL